MLDGYNGGGDGFRDLFFGAGDKMLGERDLGDLGLDAVEDVGIIFKEDIVEAFDAAIDFEKKGEGIHLPHQDEDRALFSRLGKTTLNRHEQTEPLEESLRGNRMHTGEDIHDLIVPNRGGWCG